jgi:hypothetical protein
MTDRTKTICPPIFDQGGINIRKTNSSNKGKVCCMLMSSVFAKTN